MKQNSGSVNNGGRSNESVYLDNAATTPMHPSVLETVVRAMRDEYGNPSSMHAKGRSAKALLEESRVSIAQAIGAFPDEIYFTSGGTESNNLAITGACAAFERRHGAGTIITTALEHPSVTKTVRGLKRSGWSVVYLDAPGGELDIASLERCLQKKPEVHLVTTMSVQSELGYRFPLHKVIEISRDTRSSLSKPVVHTDAVQAFGKYALDVHALDVDLLSFCSHKIGGPKGIGALYVRRGTEMFTTAFGGGQEKGLRSGTEALPLIAGFAQAAMIAQEDQMRAYARATMLKSHLVTELRRRYEDVIINSRNDGSPFIVNFTLPGIDNQEVLERLSERRVYLSTAMACSSNHTTVPPGTWREKHPLALQAAGIPGCFTRCTYRISFGSQTTYSEIQQFLQVFEEVVPSQRVQRLA